MPGFSRKLVALVCLSLMPGCATEPQNLVELTASSGLRVDGSPLGPVLLNLHRDRRPPLEHGSRNTPGRSYLGRGDFTEPTEVALLRVLARDLVLSGVASRASLGPAELPYRLDVTIRHLGASYSEGLESLVFLLPTSSVEARCALRLVFTDDVGRVFLDETFEAARDGVAAMVAGPEGEAAEALAAAIRAVIDAALPKLYTSVDQFWAAYGGRPTR